MLVCAYVLCETGYKVQDMRSNICVLSYLYATTALYNRGCIISEVLTLNAVRLELI